jgi:hypothetical protein
VSHIEKGKLYSIGAHIISKDSVTSEIVARRNVDAKTVVHAGLVYKTPVVHTFSIGGHIISLPAATKGIYALRNTDASVVLHSGIWYFIEAGVPFKIGSHMIAVTLSDKIVQVRKDGAGIAVLHHGIVFDKDEVTFMYKAVYKDVGLGSGENLAMQNIENNTVYLALYSSGVEVSGNGYARASIGFGAIYITSGEKVDSNTDATFPLATSQWDDIDEVRIFSASTGGTQYIAMSIATFDVPLNYVLQFNSGDVEVEAI